MSDDLTRALLAVQGERLTDDTGAPEDEAYNQAIDDACAAIQRLIDEETRKGACICTTASTTGHPDPACPK